MVILNLYGIPFHAVVVLGPEHDFLFKSTLTYCELSNVYKSEHHSTQPTLIFSRVLTGLRRGLNGFIPIVEKGAGH